MAPTKSQAPGTKSKAAAHTKPQDLHAASMSRDKHRVVSAEPFDMADEFDENQVSSSQKNYTLI